MYGNTILNSLKNTLKKESREHSGEGLGVSPSFNIPQEWGTFGADQAYSLGN